jgi:hypothetical protein
MNEVRRIGRIDETLADAIDRHVDIILKDSDTIEEAARRLRIDQSTLWRWRSRRGNAQLNRRLFGAKKARKRPELLPYCPRCGFDGPRGQRCPGCKVKAWLKTTSETWAVGTMG